MLLEDHAPFFMVADANIVLSISIITVVCNFFCRKLRSTANPLVSNVKGLYDVNLTYGCLDDTFLDCICFLVCIWTNVVMYNFGKNTDISIIHRH